MPDYYKEGNRCVLRGIYDNKIWIASSVIIVKDSQKETILLLLPGAQCAVPREYRRWGDEAWGKKLNRWAIANKEKIYLEEFIWKTNRILYFLEPDKYYCCCLFWDNKSNKFKFYYINFQTPYERSHCEFDTLDLDLDIIVDEQYNWKWKDQDDYQAAIQDGGIKTEWVNGIEQYKNETIERIRKKSYPMDHSWINWRPDSSWKPPRLIEGWQIIKI